MTQDVETPADPTPLKQVSEIYKDDTIKRCTCGSAAFFDCGIELINTAYPAIAARYKDFADRDHVKVCVDCKRPVIIYAGEMYDISEYISTQQIENYMKWRSQRTDAHPTPGKVSHDRKP